MFGGYPLNRITREYIQTWVNRLTAARKRPSTVRHAFFTVRMVLEQAVADGRLAKNPAEHVKLPFASGAKGGKVGVVDKSQFLTPAQVSALVAATPWPYNVLVHLAVWSGLRAAELGGLVVSDVELTPNDHAAVLVERTVRHDTIDQHYGPTKTTSSTRRVPLPSQTTELLRGYVAMHPRRHEPHAPLFPGMRLTAPRPSGARSEPVDAQAATPSAAAKARARRQAEALAELTLAEAEERLVLDWTQPLRHPTF